jgi:hypothetical protein
VVAAENRFFVQWDSVWRATQAAHRFFGALPVGYTQVISTPDLNSDSRIGDLHCHPDQALILAARAQGRLIQSRFGAYAVCPGWDRQDDFIVMDERRWIDEALNSQFRGMARDARAAVLSTLDSADRAHPSTDFIAGQRVRFLVDQRAYDSAEVAARACTATGWWCQLLTGFALAARGDLVAADSVYSVATHNMPPDRRCTWNDFHFLLEPSARDKYVAFSCAQRDSANVWFWWMSKPMFTDSVNERLVEQYTRLVLLALRTALPQDERYEWIDRTGGDARRVMVERYGWPSRVAWGSMLSDLDHTGYLQQLNSPPNDPYTTYEYRAGRIHTVPAWHAIDDPFHSVASDWTLSEPADRPASAPKIGKWVWWPVEHFQPSRPVVQLPAGQSILFRRQDSVRFALATELAPRLFKFALGSAIENIAFVRSERPGSLDRIGDVTGTVGNPLIARATVAARPAIIGLEFAAADTVGPPGGRLRFGITPPPPLSAMKPGEVAISDPLILDPDQNSALAPDAETSISRMMPTLTLERMARIGVYWETYGFAPGDSADIAVWIERYTPQGVGRRFGIALRIATDLNTPIASSWREKQFGNNASVVPGRVVTVGRSVIVDTSKLPAGDYWLDVAVGKPGGEPVRSRTHFSIK